MLKTEREGGTDKEIERQRWQRRNFRQTERKGHTDRREGKVKARQLRKDRKD